MVAGPHPNPAKAADGKRPKRLEAHPVHWPVVKWILLDVDDVALGYQTKMR